MLTPPHTSDPATMAFSAIKEFAGAAASALWSEDDQSTTKSKLRDKGTRPSASPLAEHPKQSELMLDDSDEDDVEEISTEIVVYAW